MHKSKSIPGPKCPKYCDGTSCPVPEGAIRTWFRFIGTDKIGHLDMVKVEGDEVISCYGESNKIKNSYLTIDQCRVASGLDPCDALMAARDKADHAIDALTAALASAHHARKALYAGQRSDVAPGGNAS